MVVVSPTALGRRGHPTEPRGIGMDERPGLAGPRAAAAPDLPLHAYVLGRDSFGLGTLASVVEQMSSARAALKICSARFTSSLVSA